MKTVIICHEGARLDTEGLSKWMSSFSDLLGIVILKEKPGRFFKRVKREIKRSGFIGFIDVTIFRLWYKFFKASEYDKWEDSIFQDIFSKYPEISAQTKVISSHSPNSDEVKAFLTELQPDIMLARCKTLLKPEVFQIPKTGTFVLHPGVTPEYRNAYGCFWAIANKDYDKVGTTLLQIDEGVDTGPVYEYFSYDYDVLKESHLVIQNRTVVDNLDKIAAKFKEIYEGTAEKINTSGRKSGAWGQPWMSVYLKMIKEAKRNRKNESNN